MTIGLLVAIVAVWAAAFTAVNRRADAVRDAMQRAEPLIVSAQGINTELARADASAAASFLVGGVEAAGPRQQYLDSIDAAMRELSVAAQNGGSVEGASDAIATISEKVPEYAGLIESARANNRQGFPIGAAYLRAASALLQDEIFPAAERLYDATVDAYADAYADAGAARDAPLLAFAGIVLLAALVATQILLFRRTNRVFNVPLVLATVVALVLVFMPLTAMSHEHRELARATDEGYFGVNTIARVRILAFRARGDESFALIARGNGERWYTDFDTVMSAIGSPDDDGLLGAAFEEEPIDAFSSDLADALDHYKSAHQSVQETDRAGDFDMAVTLATGDAATSSATAFAALDEELKATLDEYAARFERGAGRAEKQLDNQEVWVSVLAILVALGVVVGLQQRIREYR
ncbi:MAG TPA: hypothetical protein VFX21_10615 [Acidimicrobiia bacterium]|nr:hypothetical protein [Acidimicrobiia bacterium]